MRYISDTIANPKHTIKRGKTFHFQMRVPRHQQQLYGQSVRMKLSESHMEATTMAVHLAEVLKQAWQSNSKAKVCIKSAVRSCRPTSIIFSDFAAEYVDIRQIDPKPVKVATASLLSVVGDRGIDTYKREDARALLGFMTDAGNKTATIRRRFATISSIFNYAYQELELDKRNPFSRVHIAGEGKDVSQRGTFSQGQLAEGYTEALASGSSVRILFPILGETGCRLAEIVGLRVEDVDLQGSVVHIRPNDKRRLKTAGSERSLPLTDVACLALSKALDTSDGEWLFPRYIKEDGCYATHASNPMAKWTKARWGMTAHSLRHSFRDRLRAAEVPLEAIDQLGGCSSVSSIGSKYGNGYSVEHLREFMGRLAIV